MPLAQIIQLVSLGITAGTNLFLSFKHNADGTVDVSVTITQTQANLAADLKQANDWIASHPTTAP